MTAALREIPHLTDLRGEINLADMGAAYEQLQAQLPVLLNSNELRELERACHTRRAGKAAGLAEKSHDAAARTDVQRRCADRSSRHQRHRVARLRALQAGAGDARIVAGRITSADGCHVLINAVPEFPPVRNRQKRRR